METSAVKKPIAAYIQRNHSGDWNLYISEGNRLPVLNSVHEYRIDAKRQAGLLEASLCLTVKGEGNEC